MSALRDFSLCDCVVNAMRNQPHVLGRVMLWAVRSQERLRDSPALTRLITRQAHSGALLAAMYIRTPFATLRFLCMRDDCFFLRFVRSSGLVFFFFCPSICLFISVYRSLHPSVCVQID